MDELLPRLLSFRFGSTTTIGQSAVILLVLGLVAIAVRTHTRRILAIASILVFTRAFTPFSWPTYFLSLAPLVWMWRQDLIPISTPRSALEAIVVGFAMCWLITGFVEPAVPTSGGILHGAGCILFSFQLVGIALVTRASRKMPILRAAPLIALTALALELGQAWLGLTWATTNPSLAIATTPIAQWSGLVTPFGLSALLYLSSCLLVPDNEGKWSKRLFGPALGCAALTTLWIGGMLLEARVICQPLKFSAMLVQPNLLFKKEQAWEPWTVLDPLTTESLANSGPVDLIVWPETCLTDSWRNVDTADRSVELTAQSRHRLNLQDFIEQILPRYQTNCLLGVNTLEKGTAVKYGLTVPTTQLINCGCMVKSTGAIDCHEKQILVPMKEGLPEWFPTEFVRRKVLPCFELNAPYAAGRNFHLIRFNDRAGVERTIAAAVCYESWHPWLPQFHQTEPLDAIVYMMYDGDFVDHPELIQRQLLSVRLRAIETRTWNLVCSTWRGTAIIDPRGRIVKELPPVAGVLRTDELE